MVDFSDRKAIEGWLGGIKPAKGRRQVAVALAARAALRVTPLFAKALALGKKAPAIFESGMMLPSLRASALSWAAARYPAHGNVIRVDAPHAADDAYIAAQTATRTTDTTLADVARVARAAADAAYVAIGDAEAASRAAYAARASRVAYADAAAAGAADAAIIESGRSGAELAGLPLWPNGVPDVVAEDWQILRAALLAADEGWEVWTDWYEARLAGDAGNPPNEALEIACATIPNNIWKQGAAAVNAEIKRLTAEYDRTIRIRDAEGLMHWIEEQDASKRGEFAVMIAVRAALRALPTLSALFVESDFANLPITIVLYALRALAVPWFSIGLFPPDEILVKANAAADRAANSSTARDQLGGRILTVPAAAYSAADAYAFSLRERQPDGRAAFRSLITAAARAADLAAHAYSSLGMVGMEDPADLWAAVSADVKLLDAGRSARDLGQDPLWPGEGAPYEASAHWSTLMTKLRVANENWHVWFEWYQRRILGRAMRVGDDIERIYVDVPMGLWNEGPAQVNRWIKDRIDELLDRPATPKLSEPRSPTPQIPPPKPAALEPIFKAGLLTLPKAAAEATLPGQTISAALKALKQSLAQLADAADQETNIDRRTANRLKEIAGSIPEKRPNQTELFRLGHDYDELKSYRKSVADSCPEHVAARFTAMTLAFERTLRRFPKWVDFTREPPIEKLPAAQAHDISTVAQTLSDILRAPESRIVVDPTLPDALGDLSAKLAAAASRAKGRPDPIELGNELLAQDVLESVNNTMKRIAEGSLAAIAGAGKVASFAGKKAGSYAKEFGEGADDSLRKSSRKAGESVGPAIVKLLKRSLNATVVFAGATVTGPTLAAWLTQHYPPMFSWLESLIGFLK